MLFGILPFLVQWLALNSNSHGSNMGYISNYNYPHQPKSHWTLLTELQQLPEDEIEQFLPQICNILFDVETCGASRGDNTGRELSHYLEDILIQKCQDSLPFGLKLCGLLKASSLPPSEGLFKSFVPGPNSVAQRREEKFRLFQQRVERVTSQGSHNLPASVQQLRSTYFQDFQYLLDTLARLGNELKAYPAQHRKAYLQDAMAQCNSMLYYRMITQQSISALDTLTLSSIEELSERQVAMLCPAAAAFSLHLPIQKSKENIMRVLRFVETECEILPSKDRCPYLVVLEVLEQEVSCKSDELYTQGSSIGVTIKDAIHGRFLTRSIDNTELLSYANQGQDARVNSIATDLSTPIDPYLTTQPSPTITAGDISSSFDVDISDLDGVSIERTTSSSFSLDSHSPSNVDLFARGSSSSCSGSSGSSRSSSDSSDSYTSHSADSTTTSKSQQQQQQQQQQGQPHLSHLSHMTNDHMGLDTSHGLLSACSSESPITGDAIAKGVEERQVEGSQAGMGSRGQSESPWPPTPAATATATTTTTATPAQASVTETVSSPSVSQIRGGQGQGQRQQEHSISTATPTSTPTNTPTPPASTTAYTNTSDYHTYNSHTGDAYNAHTGGGGHESGWQQTPPTLYNSLHTHTVGQRAYEGHLSHEYPHAEAHPHHHTPHASHPHGSYDSSHPAHYPHPAQPHPQGMGGYYSSPIKPKTWQEKRQIIRSMSAFGHLPGWNLKSFIVKSGDDLRKEELTMQVIEFCQKIFQADGLDIYLRPYEIVSTGFQSGFIEYLERAQSVTHIKKMYQYGPHVDHNGQSYSGVGTGLREYFQLHFGHSYSQLYNKAISNFVKSLVGYSLITYILQVKDRHNGNILLDDEGHIVHIDFGFILGDSPGFNINFENAPFKLTREYLNLLGGVESMPFKQFEDLFLRGFKSLQRHTEDIAAIVQLFYGDKRKAAAESVRARLLFPASQTDIQRLILDSLDSWRTKQYDWYQQKTNGIFV